MKRRLFTILSALSLVLCATILFLWVRSYWVAEGWSWSDGVRVPTAGYQIAWRKVLVSHRGRVCFMMDRSFGSPAAFRRRLDAKEAAYARGFHYASTRSPGAWWEWLGFEYRTHNGYPVIASVAIGPPVQLTRMWLAPHWAAVVLTIPWPTWWLAGRGRRRYRLRHGLCLQCGYDLRATPERCPECGTVVPSIASEPRPPT